MLNHLQKQKELGKQIYGDYSWREKRWVLLHTLRSIKTKKEVKELEDFFANYKAASGLLEEQVGLYELMSRIFLYRESTVKERLQAIKDHFTLLSEKMTDDSIQSMYSKDENNLLDDVTRMIRGLVIWKSDDLNMKARLYYGPGQRKEGFLTLLLTINNEGIFHANIRLGKGLEQEAALWIGTIQGYKEGLGNSKIATKKMYGYRPKNFIVFLLQELAKIWGLESIYAVSDYGFYANTHLIRGHKAKVAELDSLWEESGGIICEDRRFFKLPLQENRKPIEEVKSQKRSQYRKRYELLDSSMIEIRDNLATYIIEK